MKNEMLDNGLLQQSAKISNYYPTKKVRFLHFVVDVLLFGFAATLFSDLLRSFGPQTATFDTLKFFSRPLFMFLFYALFEIAFQKTPAKFLTKTSSVTKKGKRPTNEQILKRTFIRFIPFEQFSYIDPDLNGWHDIYSDTRVVKDTWFNAQTKGS